MATKVSEKFVGTLLVGAVIIFVQYTGLCLAKLCGENINL